MGLEKSESTVCGHARVLLADVCGHVVRPEVDEAQIERGRRPPWRGGDEQNGQRQHSYRSESGLADGATQFRSLNLPGNFIGNCHRTVTICVLGP